MIWAKLPSIRSKIPKITKGKERMGVKTWAVMRKEKLILLQRRILGGSVLCFVTFKESQTRQVS